MMVEQKHEVKVVVSDPRYDNFEVLISQMLLRRSDVLLCRECGVLIADKSAHDRYHIVKRIDSKRFSSGPKINIVPAPPKPDFDVKEPAPGALAAAAVPDEKLVHYKPHPDDDAYLICLEGGCNEAWIWKMNEEPYKHAKSVHGKKVIHVEGQRPERDLTDVAWRIWCWSQDYSLEDMAVMKNWFGKEDLTAEEQDIRNHYLTFADEIVSMVKGKAGNGG